MRIPRCCGSPTTAIAGCLCVTMSIHADVLCLVEDVPKVLASDGTPADAFGFSVAIDGDTAIIGACNDDENGPATGSTYALVRQGDRWVEQAKLLPSDPLDHSLFGSSVALDGDVAIVGAASPYPWKSIGGGVAYIFERQGDTWKETAKLAPDELDELDCFGVSVAISTDQAIVGAYADDDIGNGSGAVYVFTREGDYWALTQKLHASDANTAGWSEFGWSFALSGDILVIGAHTINDVAGAAYVFSRVGDAWVEVAKLTKAEPVAYDFFGESIAIDGDTIIIGAPFDDTLAPNCGAAYVFTFQSGAWVETAMLLPTDGVSFDAFGVGVAIDGNLAVIGAPGDYVSGEHPGWVYVFRFDGTTWREIAKLTAPDGAGNDFFGYPVAVEGDTVLVGAYADDNQNGEDAGALYAFEVNCHVLGDADGNGCVDGFDLAFLLGEWGANPGSPADLVDSATFMPPPDGVVDGADLAFLLGAWGPYE